MSPGAFGFAESVVAERSHHLEFERVMAPTSRRTSYVWLEASEGEPDTVAEPLVEDGDGAVVGGSGNRCLMRVEWPGSPPPVFDSLTDAGATCLGAVGTAGAWRLTARFPDHDALTDWYHDFGDEHKLSVDRIRTTTMRGTDGGATRLTAPQREAMAAAFEGGYFEVPRELSLGELADRLGVSDTAASQRLRRGLATVVGQAVAPDVATADE